MWRYLRLYLYFLRFSFSRAMEFRVDFFFRVVMDTVFYLVHIAFFKIIYRHTALIGGWDFDQVLIFVCGFFLADAIHMTVAANNLWYLPQYINKGELDYYLVRPVSSLFMLSVRDFAANSFMNLLIAAGLLTWALARTPLSFGWPQLALYLLFIINGAYLYYVIHLFFILPVFWTHSGRRFEAVFYAVKQFAERPDRIFHGPIRLLLVTLLPFLLIASYPARILLDGIRYHHLLHLCLASICLTLLLLLGWRRGLRVYSSASS